MKFTTHQELQRIENAVIELQLIFNSLLNSVDGVHSICKKCCTLECSVASESCDCEIVLEDLGRQSTVVKFYLQEASVLLQKIKAVKESVSFVATSLGRRFININQADGSPSIRRRGCT